MGHWLLAAQGIALVITRATCVSFWRRGSGLCRDAGFAVPYGGAGIWLHLFPRVAL